jgi:hypothetical protein
MCRASLTTIFVTMEAKPATRRIEPRPVARAVLFVAGVVILALVAQVVGSPFVELAAGAGLYYFGWIFAANVAPQPVDPRIARLMWTRSAPLHVAVPVAAAFFAAGAAGLSLVFRLELGVGVALWFVAFLADTLQRTLGRFADRGAVPSWKPLNPVTHMLVVGLGMGPIIGLFTLREGGSSGQAVAAGAIAAAVVTPLGMLVAALSRRGLKS